MHPVTALMLVASLCGPLTSGMAIAAAQEAVCTVGPGDVLSVTVLGQPEFSSEVTVTEDGKIMLPVVGELKVEGLSLSAAGTAVSAKLQQRLVDPEVTVALKRGRPRPVYVLGEVAHAGVYERSLGWRVTEALAAAGGLLRRAQDTEGALMRAGQQPVPLDLVGLLENSSSAANLRLQPDDVLSFSPRIVRVSVTGCVLRPGVFDVPAGGNLLDALAMAGGIVPQADPSRVRVIHRDGRQELCDLVPTIIGGLLPDGNPLLAGDQVLVPQASARVAVLGAVRNPGHFDLEPGVPFRVAEAVARAGGLTSRPELIAGSIFHQSGGVSRLQIADIFLEGRAEANVLLRGGDVVSLSERTQRVSLAGQVAKPGTYDIPMGSGVIEAVAVAGGLTPKAALREAVIKRADGATTPVDLFAAMVHGDLANNPRLQPDDLVLIPESRSKVAVLGAVQRPGYYDLGESARTSVSQLVAQAGGPLKHARIGETAVIRTQQGTPVRITADLTKVLRAGRLEADVAVQDGDLVYVPDAAVDWDLLMRALSSAYVLSLVHF